MESEPGGRACNQPKPAGRGTHPSPPFSTFHTSRKARMAHGALAQPPLTTPVTSSPGPSRPRKALRLKDPQAHAGTPASRGRGSWIYAHACIGACSLAAITPVDCKAVRKWHLTRAMTAAQQTGACTTILMPCSICVCTYPFASYTVIRSYSSSRVCRGPQANVHCPFACERARDELSEHVV